jgi:hypothetical protein
MGDSFDFNDEEDIPTAPHSASAKSHAASIQKIAKFLPV